jgi:hypothetical protein
MSFLIGGSFSLVLEELYRLSLLSLRVLALKLEFGSVEGRAGRVTPF